MSQVWLGVDVGWIYPAADSDGRVYHWTSKRQRVVLPEAGPVRIKRVDGTTFTRAPYSAEAAAEALAKANDHPRVQALAREIVRNAEITNRGIALEDWTNFQRRKEAWVRVWRAIANRAEARGVPITQVDRAYTSLTCPSCGYKDRANRPTRNRFACVACGLEGQSDVIAAMNIAAKAANTFRIAPGSCANPVCDGAVAWKAGLCVTCYGFNRRRGRLPDASDVKVRQEASDLGKYRTLMRSKMLKERQAASDAKVRAIIHESHRTHDAWGNPLPPEQYRA